MQKFPRAFVNGSAEMRERRASESTRAISAAPKRRAASGLSCSMYSKMSKKSCQALGRTITLNNVSRTLSAGLRVDGLRRVRFAPGPHQLPLTSERLPRQSKQEPDGRISIQPYVSLSSLQGQACRWHYSRTGSLRQYTLRPSQRAVASCLHEGDLVGAPLYRCRHKASSYGLQTRPGPCRHWQRAASILEQSSLCTRRRRMHSATPMHDATNPPGGNSRKAEPGLCVYNIAVHRPEKSKYDKVANCPFRPIPAATKGMFTVLFSTLLPQFQGVPGYPGSIC